MHDLVWCSCGRSAAAEGNVKANEDGERLDSEDVPGWKKSTVKGQEDMTVRTGFAVGNGLT
eukprot:365533-Chlamydomonas_euryale.AAC.9